MMKMIVSSGIRVLGKKHCPWKNQEKEKRNIFDRLSLIKNVLTEKSGWWKKKYFWQKTQADEKTYLSDEEIRLIKRDSFW